MDTHNMNDVLGREISSRLVERRLRRDTKSLSTLRTELEIIEEQLIHFENEAHDLGVRALVAETPLADAESREAQRHMQAMTRQRDHLRASIVEIEERQDQLLDRLGGEQ